MEKVLKINVPEGYEVDKEKSTFESIVFRVLPEKKLPESWRELGEIKGFWVNDMSNLCEKTVLDGTYEVNRNIWPTREEAEASIALAQLLQLRDRYNEGWRPDWSTEDNEKWIIYPAMGTAAGGCNYISGRSLAFKTKELRDKFLSCPEIRKLIEIAKPLL